MKLVENKDYRLEPVNVDGQERWDIRILEGEFAETVVRFGTLTPDPANQEIRFTFDIVSTPDLDLTEENKGLQDYCTILLSAIIPDTMEI